MFRVWEVFGARERGAWSEKKQVHDDVPPTHPFWLKPFLSNITLLSRVLTFWVCSTFASCVSRTFIVHRGWQSMDILSGWLQVLRGPRPKSVQWPFGQMIVSNHHKWEFPGVGANPESAKGAPPVGPRPRINPDVAREMAHTKVSRLEKALEAMGDLQGPVVEALKADLEKAKAASKKQSVEVEIDECRKFISRRIRELDTERDKEQSWTLVEAQERLEKLVDEQSRCPETHDMSPGVTSDRAPANGQFVAVRAR